MRAVFLRELGSLSRRPILLVLFTALLIGLAAVVSAGWPTDATLNPDEIATRGDVLWRGALWLELAFVTLLAPAVGAPALSSERRGRTLTLVMLSGVHPLTFAGAKLAARIALLALVVMLPFPALLAVATLGGADISGALLAASSLLAYGTFACALGILFSAVFQETHRTIALSYLGLAALFAAPYLLPALGLSSSALVTGRYELWEAWVSPQRGLEYLLEPTLFGAGRPTASSAWIQPALMLGGTVLCLLATWPFTALAATGRYGQPVRTRRASLLRRLTRKLWGRGPAATSNPIYWRETSVESAARFESTQRLGAYAAILVLLLVALQRTDTVMAVLEALAGATVPTSLGSSATLTVSDATKVHGVVAGLLLTLVALATTLGATASLSDERQSGLLQQVAVTPLKFSTFVWGKALGAMHNLALVIALPTLYLVGNAIFGDASVLSVVIVLPASILTAGFCSVQGLYCGLAATSPTRALVAALMLLGGEFFLPLFCLISFNPLMLGYVTVISTSPDATGADHFVFSIIAAVSMVVHGGALLFVSRRLKGSFDAFLGRVGDMELKIYDTAPA